VRQVPDLQLAEIEGRDRDRCQPLAVPRCIAARLTEKVMPNRLSTHQTNCSKRVLRGHRTSTALLLILLDQGETSSVT
jgi:hypothetical protein